MNAACTRSQSFQSRLTSPLYASELTIISIESHRSGDDAFNATSQDLRRRQGAPSTNRRLNSPHPFENGED